MARAGSTSPALRFGSSSPFDSEEQDVIRALWDAILTSSHAARDNFLGMIRDSIRRSDAIGTALASYPSLLGEESLGARHRDLSTLVDLLVQATDANFDMLIPTRAILGRAVVMAELNSWRLFHYVFEEIRPDGHDSPMDSLGARLDADLHGCVYTKLTEEVLSAISYDGKLPRPTRALAVRHLSQLWENRLNYRVRDFFPLLEATWNARRRIRVSVGTMLGISEIFRLILAGCDPHFVEFFSRAHLTEDESQAFQEFLIGVPMEEIHSLSQLMEKTGKSSLSAEEAWDALRSDRKARGMEFQPVLAYESFRERFLQAAARRLKNLPGPKKTAEEYVMIYFLEHSGQ